MSEQKASVDTDQSPIAIQIDYGGIEGYAVMLIVMPKEGDVPPMIAATCELELLAHPRVKQAFNRLAEMVARTAHEAMFPQLGPLIDFVQINPERKLN